MSRFILIFAIFAITAGCNDCRYYAKEFKKRQFIIIVQKKYIHDYKQTAFEGLDLDGKKALLDEVGFWNLYDMVEVGDTLRKELGTADIKVFRKDTSLVCHWECSSGPVE
ncbi:hypothetical protein L3C95_19915 [Chitinophaga filiformis]|uniref:hypothetical protein n=1 Tax=Chitinophaga filiformis TaxID=104663 RepID=UPI001F39D342|nr:hypothetical protein [Chitinophaga filiformis]MCF6405180.1 hypothetical protein [Chitinophaga filiformis]